VGSEATVNKTWGGDIGEEAVVPAEFEGGLGTRGEAALLGGSGPKTYIDCTAY